MGIIFIKKIFINIFVIKFIIKVFNNIYIKNKNFELDYIFIYGTLMRGCVGHKKLNFSDKLDYIEDGKVKGVLYDLGNYPELIIDENDETKIKGELYNIKDNRILDDLDKFESYNSDNPEESLYIRDSIKVFEPDAKAWVYIYNKSIDNADVIRSGD